MVPNLSWVALLCDGRERGQWERAVPAAATNQIVGAELWKVRCEVGRADGDIMC